ncbi:MAG: 3-deoxy-D-manno-octulosonic acid transferase, partial [Rubrivivax sp.]
MDHHGGVRGRLARAVYTTALRLATPLYFGRLWWRGRHEPGYREHIGERFGRDLPPIRQPVLWIHAVSLGET